MVLPTAWQLACRSRTDSGFSRKRCCCSLVVGEVALSVALPPAGFFRSVRFLLALLSMSVQIWSCCAFAAALIVAAFCQNSDGGKFKVTITIKKDLVNERENHWKLWCSTAYNTCQKTGRGLTTGHNARTDQQSDVPEDVMVAIETCYAFCMERYPPAAPVQSSDTYPFGPADIVSYKCSDAFNATVCFSACLHHDHQSTLTTLGALLNKDFSRLGSCEQLCRQSRGVCARAFAPNTTEQNDECYQNCLSSTICEDMCHATSNLPSVTDGTGSRAPLNLLSRTHPRITRPLNNRTLWEDGVLEFTQGGIGARSVKIDQVYGLLWKLVNKDKTYFMAHHMSFFYLPDEVKYHRLPANFFSLPKDFECDRFEIVTAAVRAQSTSLFSEQDFVCAPGLSVPDPPSDVSVTLAFMNYTILDLLTFNLRRPSTEAVYCDYYLAKFIAGGQANSTTMSIPTDQHSISLKGQELLVGGKSILDSNVTLSLACVSNSITGLDELNWPTQSVFQTKVSLRALAYCGSHINEPTLVVNKASDPDTGFWSLNLTFRITAAQVSPQKFLYLGARGGQNMVYRVTNVLANFTVPLKVGVFSYEQTLQSISPGEVTISGEVEESAQFKTELERISCSKCCLLDGTRDFKQKVSLKEIQPSPPMNVTLASQQLNTTARFLSITLRVLPPKHSAGRIARFRVKFGGPKVPNLFETTIAYNDSGIKNETILLSFQAPFEDVDDRWDFEVAAISNFSTQSEWFNFSMPSPYSIRPETGGQFIVAITAALSVLGAVLIIVIVSLVFVVLCCCRGTKVVFVPSVWFGTRTADTQDDQEEAMLTFEPDSWELDPEKITMDHLLGEGSFGQVYKGVLQGPVRTPGCETATSLSVAVKLLGMNASLVEKNSFLKEIELMKRVSSGRCPYVVNTIGSCTLQEPLALVLEYMAYGDLLTYLRTSRQVVRMREMLPDTCEDETEGHVVKFNEYVSGPGSAEPLTPAENPYSRLGDLEPANLISFAYQIAAGMEYLTSLGLVHRDLACRNVLLGENKQLKVSDFGLAREGELYVKTTAGRLPLRWMAIEAITERVFTQKTDVWAFGVVLWEIATLGGCPYPTITNHALLPYLVRGNRLEKPSNCSAEMYEIMLGCWKGNPDERLSFMELRSLFDAMMVREKESYININDIEELLPYYPMSAVCDTTDGSDDNNGGSLSPKDYEVPITHTNRFRMSQCDPTQITVAAGIAA